MTNKRSDTVLMLPSWYPSQLDISNGDFIQRHVQAIAAQYKVHVIHVVKDEKRLVTSTVKESIVTAAGYTEQVIYYGIFRTGIKFIDQFLSYRKYITLYKKAIKKYISENGRPALVHVHVAMKAGLLGLWIKKNYALPYILTEHWTGYYRQSIPNIFEQNAYLQHIAKRVLQGAASFCPVSNDLGKTINENFAAVDYTPIPNVVNTALFFYQPFATKRFRFIHPSYLNYQKNPHQILAACRLLLDKGYDFELVFIGNKQEQVMCTAKELGLLDINVFFEAAIPYHAIAAQMQRSNALLLFSLFENLPCVILEALCCGLPVISSSVGGIPEAINTSNGILVESNAVEQLVDAMESMITNYHKYDRATISANAKKIYNYQTIGKRYKMMYDQLR